MTWGEICINIVLPVLAIIIPVFTTVYMVNRRVENENKETHRPYLVLHKITGVEYFNIYAYHLTWFGQNFLKKYSGCTYEEMVKKEEPSLNVKLLFKNIGYGVATNIKFYDLLTAEEIYGTQMNNENQNQKLFTTFDIASSDEKDVQAKILNTSLEDSDGVMGDYSRILCVYQDLNGHIYSFIFSINVKGQGHYDFFAYQPSSRSYKKWIRQNKRQYRSILAQYNRL